jgi:signal transduction histidine kinase
MGGGVAILPEALFHPPEPGKADAARAVPAGESHLVPLEFDARRVEVAERDRQMLRYVAPVRDGDRDLGSVELSIPAAPLFDAVRRFEPSPHVRVYLVERGGDYLAHPDRAKENGRAKGSGESFARDFPGSQALLRGGAAVAEESGHRLLAAGSGPPADDGRPAWILVADFTPASLEAISGTLHSELAGIALALAAVVAAILAVAGLVVRTSIAEARAKAAVEAAHRQAESERLQTLARVTAGVAHEINNPLEGIRNYLALLEREAGASPERRESLAGVRHGFERIRDLARDLLDLAHPKPPRRAQGRIEEVLTRVERVVRHDRSFSGVEWRARLDSDLPEISIDGYALEQVFLNLALNSRDAMAGQGVLEVSARRAAHGGIEVDFTDTGRGIPPDALSRIFEPFYSLRGGTGLGLSVSRSIVAAHGGTIVASNRATGGAAFRIELPPGSAAPGARAGGETAKGGAAASAGTAEAAH